MEFGKADEKDIAELVQARLDYLSEDYGGLDKDTLTKIAEKLPEYFKEHLNKDLRAFVCRYDEKIVGCCFLCVTEKPSNPNFINGKTGTVLNVYTRTEFRRQGIAGRLMRLLLAEAAELKLDFVELKATDSGYSLYKSLGFEDVVTKYHNMKFVIE